MTRERFRILKRYLHLTDNQKLAYYKVAKVLPFYQHLCNRFQQFGVFHEELSIDEEMVPYHGHHSAKLFLKTSQLDLAISCGYSPAQTDIRIMLK